MLLSLCACLGLLEQQRPSAAVSILQGRNKCHGSAGTETAALRKVSDWIAALQSQPAPVRAGHPGGSHACPRCDRRGIVWTESRAEGGLLNPCGPSEAISHLWAAGGISQQHFPSLRREKARAHRGEPAHIITSVLFQT